GIELRVSVGDHVEAGRPVARIPASTDSANASAVARVLAAIHIVDEPPTPTGRIIEIVSQEA
nr:hypothetical protein [bacterium]